MPTETALRELEQAHTHALDFSAGLHRLADSFGPGPIALWLSVAILQADNTSRALKAALQYEHGPNFEVPTIEMMLARKRVWDIAQAAGRQGFTPYIDPRDEGHALSFGIDFGGHMTEVGIDAHMIVRNQSWLVSVERRLGL